MATKKSATQPGVLKRQKKMSARPDAPPASPTYCTGCGVETEQRKWCAPCDAKRVKHAGGRPTLYDPLTHPERAYALCLLGATEEQMAKILNISEATFAVWKNTHEEFLDSVRKGRSDSDSKVAVSLYQRACGYSHPDVDIRVVDKEIVETPIIKHYPPETIAGIFWLKNRRPREWRDRSITEVVGKDDGPVQVEVSPTDFRKLREKVNAAKKGKQP